MKNLFVLSAIAIGVAMISGCAGTSSTSVATAPSSLQSSQSAREGVVVSTRSIYLKQDRAPLTARAETQQRSLAQVGGAILSAVTDESTDDFPVQRDAQEITVRFDNGDLRTVTQNGADVIKLNQRVKVINAPDRTYVVSI